MDNLRMLLFGSGNHEINDSVAGSTCVLILALTTHSNSHCPPLGSVQELVLRGKKGGPT